MTSTNLDISEMRNNVDKKLEAGLRDVTTSRDHESWNDLGKLHELITTDIKRNQNNYKNAITTYMHDFRIIHNPEFVNIEMIWGRFLKTNLERTNIITNHEQTSAPRSWARKWFGDIKKSSTPLSVNVWGDISKQHNFANIHHHGPRWWTWKWSGDDGPWHDQEMTWSSYANEKLYWRLPCFGPRSCTGKWSGDGQ